MLTLFHTILFLIGIVYSYQDGATVAPTLAPPPAPFVGPAQCLLTLPLYPLSAVGLSTPFQLQGLTAAQPCTMANIQTTTFVEAVIFDPLTNHLSVYHPMVVDAGTQPLLPPILPIIPNTAIIALFFGTNGISLNLQPLTIMQQTLCMNGISQTDIFGQFAHCNAVALYSAINKALDSGQELIPPLPPLGKAIDGEDCPTTRSFFIVDQDPSDNLVTTYLLDPVTGKVLMDIPATRAQYPTAIILKNGSDNRLLTVLNLVLGCTSYTIPVLNDQQGQYHVATLPTNEIHAARMQKGAIALVPKGDPMTRVLANGAPISSLVKINAYRKGVNQPQITTLDQAPTNYFCVHMLEQLGRLQNNKALFTTQLSADPAAATNLFTFLANRFFQSYQNLKCDIILDVINPVNLVLQNNIVIDATFTIVPKIDLDQPDPYLIQDPTPTPTQTPTQIPTKIPTQNPTQIPTQIPTKIPTATPVSNMTTPDPMSINNVPASSNTGKIYIIIFSVSGALILLSSVYYYYKNKQNTDYTKVSYPDKEPMLQIDMPGSLTFSNHTSQNGGINLSRVMRQHPLKT